jgi:hypothetical protein
MQLSWLNTKVPQDLRWNGKISYVRIACSLLFRQWSEQAWGIVICTSPLDATEARSSQKHKRLGLSASSAVAAIPFDCSFLPVRRRSRFGLRAHFLQFETHL